MQCPCEVKSGRKTAPGYCLARKPVNRSSVEYALRGALSEVTLGRQGDRALRSSASRNGPFGLCQAEAFGNSFADSVSFRFPSWQSLDGPPFLRLIALRALPPLRRKSAANKNRKGPGRLQAWPLNSSSCSVSCYVTVHRKTLAGGSKLSSTSYVVCLVHLVHLVCVVHRLGLIQPNKRDRPNKPNNGLLTPPSPGRRTRGREPVLYRPDRFRLFRISHRGLDRPVEGRWE